jgi:hypothetical protein
LEREHIEPAGCPAIAAWRDKKARLFVQSTDANCSQAEAQEKAGPGVSAGPALRNATVYASQQLSEPLQRTSALHACIGSTAALVPIETQLSSVTLLPWPVPVWKWFNGFGK